MKVATSIQERLWELRKDKGLNLEELSKLTGISKSALGSYEKEDYKEINHGNLITLADFYGVSVDYLLCRTENRDGSSSATCASVVFVRAWWCMVHVSPRSLLYMIPAFGIRVLSIN